MSRRLACALLVLAFASPAGSLLAQESACGDCHEIEDDPILSSPHADFECGDCHAEYDEELHPEEVVAPACEVCHDDAVAEVGESVHAELGLAPEGAATVACSDCHGKVHELVAGDDPASPVHVSRLATSCGGCHADPELAERFRFRLVQPLEAYLSSVHALAVENGDEGASCSDCHGSHRILAAAHPESAVNRWRVPETCGACHAEIAATYAGSVHGQAVAHGIGDSPVCTDCHGEHRILSPAAEGSPVFASNIPKLTCGRCHSDLRLAEKYGLDADKVPAYEDSYHGLAGRAGTLTVAHCGSCHGIHDILPSSDPASHVHKENLAETCGACHPGAGSIFTIGLVHVLPTEPEHAAIFWIRRLYLWLIVLVIGAMVIHNGADLLRKGGHARAFPVADPPAPQRERLSLGFRIAHALLAVSFIVLVYSGFALKYPEAWWAAPLSTWESGFGFRGWLHRAAAVVLGLATLFHLIHLVMDRGARACIERMRPTRADWTELKERVAWFAGRRSSPPRAPWVGYPEKMEYLAVVWGTVLMGVTGLLLWFETATLRWLPSWAMDVATVIHFYEAILATLAILVWHFYFVIFDPLVYPMDPAWLSGRSAPGRAAEREAPEPPAAAPAPRAKR